MQRFRYLERRVGYGDKAWRKMQKPSCKWFAAMIEETPFYVYWPRELNSAVQGRLVDIDVDSGLCKLDCEFLFTDWTEIVLSSAFGLGQKDLDRLPLLPVPGAPVLARLETKSEIDVDLWSVAALFDYLVPLLREDDYKFFEENLWQVNRYRQMAISNSDDEWLMSGYAVEQENEL